MNRQAGGKGGPGWWQKLTSETTWHSRVAIAGVFALILAVEMVVAITPMRVDVVAGQIAPRTIRAPREIVDRVATEALQQQAADAVKPVFDKDTAAVDRSVQQVDQVFAMVRMAQKNAGSDRNAAAATLHGDLVAAWPTLDIPDTVLVRVLSASPTTLDGLEGDCQQIVRSAMDSGIQQESLPTFQAAVIAQAGKLDYSRDLQYFAGQVASTMLAPNLIYNDAATQARRQEAREAVPPVRVLKGQVVIEQGTPVTEHQLAILQDLGLLRSANYYRSVGGTAALAVLLVIITALYISRFEPAIFQSRRRLVLMGTVSTLTVLLGVVLERVSGYLVPVAMGTMLTATLLSLRMAAAMAFLLALPVGAMMNFEFAPVMVAVTGGLAGVFSIGKVGRRSDISRAGLVVGFTNGVVITTVYLVTGMPLGTMDTARDLLWGFMNGLMSAVLTFGLLPYFENLFGVVTALRLMELANPNQPLLRRLLLEAPGTYHHSIMVANLAEAAVEATGGDSLLARVGAYYHDVGKIKRPMYFVDNQFGGINPHDDISPVLSALIITSHVRDGVELAREYKLPEPVIDFIRQHHGTTMAGYFFRKAESMGLGPNLHPEDFHYPGPVPQSREVAAVMLADACEAVVRSVKDPTPARVDAAVRKVIQDRLLEGQLDQCDLTLRDLNVMAETFTRMLTGMFHMRVDYQEGLRALAERAGAGAAAPAGGAAIPGAAAPPDTREPGG